MAIVVVVLGGCAAAFSDVSTHGHSVYSSNNPVNKIPAELLPLDMRQCLNIPPISAYTRSGIDFEQTPTIESFCNGVRARHPEYPQCYADCETRFAESFNRERATKEQREIDNRLEQERIAERKRAEDAAIKEEEQRVSALHDGLRSGSIQPEDMRQAKIAYDAGDGFAVAKSPKLRPDGQLYALSGSISAAEDGTAVFFGEVTNWSNSLIPIKEFNYIGVRIPKELQDHYFDNARINGWFGIVGRYVDNSSYKNILGSSQQTIPVFDAVYLELER